MIGGIALAAGERPGNIVARSQSSSSLTRGLLGVHAGQADLRIDGVRCGKPALVA